MTLTLRKIAAASIIVAGACLICAIFVLGVDAKSVTDRDYIQYWAVGKLLRQNANPYSLPAILAVEQSAGLESNDPKASVGPPVSLVLLAPLGWVDAKTGLILWLLAQLGSVSLALWLFWTEIGRPDSRIHLLGYLFPPVLACLQAGQLGIFMLLGIVLFLSWLKARPVLAGMALMPCALKPHLFLPFGAALLVWMVVRGRMRVLAGFVAAVAATSGLTLLMAPRAWTQYEAFLRSTRLLDIPLPTLSAELRFHLAPQAIWLQYLPAVAASFWAAWYCWSRRDRWDWMNHGQVTLLVSLLSTPYAWLTDEAVVLPAVLVGLYQALATRRSWIPIALFEAIALTEVLRGLSITSWYYSWTTTAWLLWFLYARAKGTEAGMPGDAVAASEG
jgi:Glycosyltransferase family 87